MDDQREQAADAASTEPQDSAASGAGRESESTFFNRVLRGARDWLTGADEEPSPRPEEPGAPAAGEQPTAEPPASVTMSREEFARAVQSAKDRELAAERRRDALASAEAGDVGPIRRLAERGDGWARQQLAERGETWALGEIHEAELKRQAQAAQDPIPHVASLFDQAILHPLLGALPEAEEQRIVGQGILGVDGRKAAAEEAVKVIQREARHAGAEGAVTRALSDQAFAERLLRSPTFRAALLKVPAANKQFLTAGRNDREEGDLNVAAGAGSTVRRESDFMNSMLRDAPAWGAESN